jgi:crossover junction endodeoxyribonuclease RuvC
MRVLGIDPGSRVTGWGVVESGGAELRHLGMGVVSPTGTDLAGRLGSISRTVERLIADWNPESLAIECAFVGKNVASALRIGEVRGAVLAVAGRVGVGTFEYTPATVKSSVTGSGAAEKEVVARSVAHLLGGSFDAGDAADALAVAICHLRHAVYAARLGGR